MGLLALRLTDFRNIRSLRLDLDGRDVFLVGDNGQGKTNFLEAVYMLCYGASFRTRNDRDLIANGVPETTLWGRLSTGEEERGVGVALARSDGKRIAIDGKRIRDRARLIEFAPAIAFTHEDLRFIDGDPERRRSLFDHTLSLFDPLFIDVLRRYRRALRGRNALLRAVDTTHVEIYDPVLAAAGVEIQRRRAGLCDEFSEVFSELCAKIGGIATAQMEYRPSWRGVTAVQEAQELLRQRRERDLQLRTTTSGPHRDDVLFTMERARFAAQGSTGQKRLASLVLRVAQAEFFQRTTGRRPILLLDDVLLELDSAKRERFLDQLPAYDQAFFTFLPDEPHERYGGERTLRLAVAAGNFAPCTEPQTC